VTILIVNFLLYNVLIHILQTIIHRFILIENDGCCLTTTNGSKFEDALRNFGVRRKSLEDITLLIVRIKNCLSKMHQIDAR
jgi:hypothetical protein